MISAGATLLMAVLLSTEPVELFDRVSANVAAERVSRCGLGEVTSRYDEDLQSEVLVAADSSVATDDQLRCADNAASYYDLMLPPSVQARYNTLRNARLSSYFAAEATAWLTVRGLLDRVPQYEASVTNDAAFTQEVETLCGPRAAGAFQSEFGFHALSPDWLRREQPVGNPNMEVLECLLNVTRVAGFEVGFIGNEAFSR